MAHLGHFCVFCKVRLPPDFWPRPNCNEQYENRLNVTEAAVLCIFPFRATSAFWAVMVDEIVKARSVNSSFCLRP